MQIVYTKQTHLVCEYLLLPESHLTTVPIVTDKPALPTVHLTSVSLWQFGKPEEMNESAFLEELNKLTFSVTQIERVCSHKKISLVQIIICSEQWIWSLPPLTQQHIGYLAPLSLFYNILRLICTIQGVMHRFILDLCLMVTSKYWWEILECLWTAAGYSRESKYKFCLWMK